MAAEVLKQSYVLATGYAALMGADAEAQHLFARRYDYEVTVDRLAVDWSEFAMASRRAGDPVVVEPAHVEAPPVVAHPEPKCTCPSEMAAFDRWCPQHGEAVRPDIWTRG